MTLTFYPYEPVDLSRGLCLEIHSAALFQSFVAGLLTGFEAGGERAVLFEGDKQISFGSGAIITDLFRFDVTDRKLSARLCADLVRSMQSDEEFMADADRALGRLRALVGRFTHGYPVDIALSDVGLEELVKTFSPHVEPVFGGIAPALCSFIQLAAQLNLYRFIAVVGLRDLLGSAADEALATARACALPLILIDRFPHPHPPDTSFLLIPSDFDETLSG